MAQVEHPIADRRFLAVQVLTLSRIPLAVLFALLLVNLEWGLGSFLICFVLLLAIELTDLLDGIVARRLGLVTEWGAMLDPYADSTARLIVFWALASEHLVLGLVPLVMALRDVSVAYCRIILSRHGQSVSARLSGKIKAVVQCAAAWTALPGPYYYDLIGRWTIPALSWLVIVVTALSAVQYAQGAFQAARAAERR